jgi:hypothetical protein
MRKCCVCGRKPTVPSEGRVINGSWVSDHELPRRLWRKWVCSYACYAQALTEARMITHPPARAT